MLTFIRDEISSDNLGYYVLVFTVNQFLYTVHGSNFQLWVYMTFEYFFETNYCYCELLPGTCIIIDTIYSHKFAIKELNL